MAQVETWATHTTLVGSIYTYRRAARTPFSRKEHPHRDLSTALRSVEKHFQERLATADLSTTLLRSSGRDDKGKGGASGESGGRIEAVFHHLGWAEAMTPPVEMTKERVVVARSSASP